MVYHRDMSVQPPDIVGLGVIAVDDMLEVDSYPPANSKVRIKAKRRQGGGNISCALMASARLGSRCRQLGRLGDNEHSEFCRHDMTDAGIDLSCLLHEPSAEPLYCTIVLATDLGSRSIYADYTAVQPLQPDELRPEWFAGARVFLTDNMYAPAILPALKMARAAGLVTVSDIEKNLPRLDAIRSEIDHYICSAEFALPHTGCDTPEDACKLLIKDGYHETVIITAGEFGCYWMTRDDGEVHHLPAHGVEAVDTTGCGDVFHGAFCHGLVNSWPLEENIAFANAAAAVKATRTGGWVVVPHLHEVEQLRAKP